MKHLLAAAIVLAATGAVAQPAPPPTPYVPFVVDEESYVGLRTYLNQQPFIFSSPVVGWLDRMEAAAIAKKAADDKAAADKAPAAPAERP